MRAPHSRGSIPYDILKEVSRSFYLTLRVLPAPVRRPISLAYLLARAADTIADGEGIESGERLARLTRFREGLSGSAPAACFREAASLAPWEGLPDGEARLLSSLSALFDLLHSADERDRRNIQTVVGALICGMEFDVRTFFAAPGEGSVRALTTLEELDRYTYLVAGCVGEFWTDALLAHTAAFRTEDRARMAALGVRFGRALQMTNILRDAPRDLSAGRCYLPREALSRRGIEPDELLSAGAAASTRGLLFDLTRRTLDDYRAAVEYVAATSRAHARLRLAMAWPILIGLATLRELLSEGVWLNSGVGAKIPRRRVYALMLASLPAAWSNAYLMRCVQRLMRGVERAM